MINNYQTAFYTNFTLERITSFRKFAKELVLPERFWLSY